MIEDNLGCQVPAFAGKYNNLILSRHLTLDEI